VRVGRVWTGLLLLLLLAGAAGSVTAAPHVPRDSIDALDRQTGVLLERLAQGRMRQARALAEQMVARHPDYRLGQLLHAELLSIQALDAVRPLSAADWPEELVDLLLEARTRLAIARQPERQSADAPLPRALVQLGHDITGVLMVDLSNSELRHYRVHAGHATLASRHYVSSGSAGFGKWREGDRRTPLGVYRIEALHDDAVLPELYGAAALTLDYPNALDRQLGRTGSGIWLHGVPRDHPSRAPWSSEGCVTMSNEHLMGLIDGLDRAGTIVVLSDRIDDVPGATRAALAQDYRRAFDVGTDSTLIEVPTRGAVTHVAHLAGAAPTDAAPATLANAQAPAPTWRFLPVNPKATDSPPPPSL